MFIEIRAKAGVFRTHTCINEIYELRTYHKVLCGYRFNLGHASAIYFGKFTEARLQWEMPLFGDHLSWEDLIGCHYISFSWFNTDEIGGFTLFFNNEAMGEFHRIKRAIDEYSILGCTPPQQAARNMPLRD